MATDVSTSDSVKSRLAWGVWVEIWFFHGKITLYCGHASHEACELKFNFSSDCKRGSLSRLAWGVWVEIILKFHHWRQIGVTPRMRRVSWNVPSVLYVSQNTGHASHEACELKSVPLGNATNHDEVTPRMRRVSWNYPTVCTPILFPRHASHEACELKYSEEKV